MRLLIDCCGIGYRIAYGMPVLSYDGNNTHIIFGFLNQLLDLAKKFNTNQFIFCWDSRQSYRKEFDSTYKERDFDSTREALIKDARRQFNLLYNDVLPMMGFKNIFMKTGYEADDLIAWFCFRKPDDYMIVSVDEDLLQLLFTGRFYSTRIYDFKKERVITAEEFTSKYGLEPIQWAKVKAMAGCSSDNVPGITGIGKETAIKYLNGNLKDGKAKAKIESAEGKKIIDHCFYLVALPFPGDRPIQIDDPVDDKLCSLDFLDTFRQYGFGSFEKNIAEWRNIFKLARGR